MGKLSGNIQAFMVTCFISRFKVMVVSKMGLWATAHPPIWVRLQA